MGLRPHPLKMSTASNLIRGSLTSAALLGCLSETVFVASKMIVPDDEHQMGWRLAQPKSPLKLSFERLEFATSEGINALAVLFEALDFGKKSGLIGLDFVDKQSQELANVMGLRGMFHRDRAIGLKSLQPCLVDSYSTGSCMVELSDADSAHHLAQQIIQCSSQVIAKISKGQLFEFSGSLDRAAIEGLLNVYEHAFIGSGTRRVFVCATVFRADELLDANPDALDEAETAWLMHHGEKYLYELAISDAGLGIPRTLWQDAKRRKPELFEKFTKLSSATREYKLLRSEIHAHLCLDAFHHESTRKQWNDFKDLYHGLNWRGLYRGRQPITSYEGFVALSSGRGRAGYMAIGDETVEFTQALGLGSDLPGTTLTIRLPLPLDKSRLIRRPRPLAAEEREQAAVLNPPLFEWKDLVNRSAFELKIVAHRVQKKDIPCFSIVFPFLQITSENFPSPRPANLILEAQLLRELRALPPDIVPILFYLEIAEPFGALARVWEQWTLGSGHPRLICVWQMHSKRLIWRVAGVFPLSAQQMLRDLEDNGIYTLPIDSSPDCYAVAQGLSVNYPRFVSFDSERRTLQLILFSARIDKDFEEQAFETAFAQHWSQPDIKQRVITDDPQRPVRVHTGRRVRRYLCVLYLVESSPVLASIVGHKILDCIEGWSPSQTPVLVADDYGSAFVAQRLLVDVPNELSILSSQQAKALPAGSAVVLFVDAIFKGQTLKELIRDLTLRSVRVLGVLSCVDLRKEPTKGLSPRVPIQNLLKISDFDAEELSPEIGPDEIQIDGLTHVPVIADASDFLEIGTDPQSSKLLTEGVFDHGFHELGGRLHTITLPVSKLLESAREGVVDCLVQKLTVFLMEYVDELTDVVFFYRSESEIGKLVDDLYERLYSLELIKAGFQRSIPTASRGPRTIFSHIAVDVLSDCQLIEQQRSMFGSDRELGKDFVAVYLDDAAVTGRALRSFLFRVMRNRAMAPRAVAALVIVNRLSPGETRVFSLCQTLESADAQSTRVAPFSFDSLFRLQVISRETKTRNAPLLRRVSKSAWIPDKTIRRYLESLITRLSSDPDKPVRHVFVEQPNSNSKPLSPDAAQLRHLLALHQQNEGVVAEVLQTFTRMKQNRDLTLFNLLALEPDLLDEPPLSNICRRDIVNMSVETLVSDQSVEDKSDALAVLAWYETAFFEHLSDFVDIALADETLRKQLVLYILTLFSRTEAQQNKWGDALHKVSSSRAKEWSAWALEIVNQAKWFHQAIRSVRTEEVAETHLRRLIASMARHSEDSEEHWESLLNQLRPMRSDWETFAHQKAQENVLSNAPHAGELVRDVFIPALAALVFRSDMTGNDELAQLLRDDLARAMELSERWSGIIPKDLSDVTSERVSRLFETLEDLRKVTWSGNLSSSDVLSRLERGSVRPPLFGIARYYCAPWVTLLRMANELRVAQGLKSFDDTLVETSVLVSPIPVESLRQILRPLLQNVEGHGRVSSLKISKRYADRGRALVLQIQNVITKAGGVGLGLEMAHGQARRFKVQIKIPSRVKNIWLTEIWIPSFFVQDAMRRRRT